MTGHNDLDKGFLGSAQIGTAGAMRTAEAGHFINQHVASRQLLFSLAVIGQKTLLGRRVYDKRDSTQGVSHRN